jgi:SAM-dependent methyltransferase
VAELANRYDQVLYPGRAYPEAHPDQLAVCAHLLGLETTRADGCRLLELGCGNGAHLLSLACALPNSQFVGIDGSERAIAAGRELARELRLENLTLEHADLSGLELRGPKFDYVVSHGVYSWIPPAAQNALLAACRHHLAENGVAYVSYNTYPGAHARELVREMMLFHAGEVADPRAKVARGIEFVRFVRAAQPEGSSIAAVLDLELERLTHGSPEYVFHDDFSEYNVPVYFGAFIGHAAAHGLKFLNEADFSFVEDPRVPPNVRNQLREYAAGDPIAEQQYIDFLVGCAFRRTLLVPDAAPVARQAPVPPARLLGLHASTPLKPKSPAPNVSSPGAETFTHPEHGQVVVEDPLAKAALLLLGRAWPLAIEVGELVARAQEVAGAAFSGDRQHALEALGSLLLRAAAFKQLDLRQTPDRFAATPGERPCASPLARAQIKRSPYVTSLRHLSIRLDDEPSQLLLELLDGTRTRSELLQLLLARVNKDSPQIRPQELNLENLEGLLAKMAEYGVLTD